MNTEFHLTYLSGGDAYFGPNYGGATVNTVTRTGFANECANLGRLFKQMTFDVGLENQIIADVLQKKMSVNAAARRALQAHPKLLEPWLEGVTTADGANGLQAVNSALAGN
jgi:glycine betaine/proline transport system substrate-binding protein